MTRTQVVKKETQQNQEETSAPKVKQDDSGKTTALLFAKAALEKNAEALKILDLRGISGFTDYFVLANGASAKQVQSIVNAVKEQARQLDLPLLSVEGYSEGRWVLADFGEIVVHVFQEELRDFYHLDTLWEDAPVVDIPNEYYAPQR